MSYRLIDFDDFPIIYGVIKIPKNTVLYRGYDTRYPVISDRPAYFTSNASYASSYSNSPNHTNGTFITTKDITMYDLRYIRNILTNLFQQRKSNSTDVINTCYTLALSYGLCTLEKQLELYKIRYIDKIDQKIIDSLESTLATIKDDPIRDFINPIQAQGYRYAETNNDADSGLILRRLFTTLTNHKIDGYVSPYLFSPFHVEKMKNYLNPEILLFEPSTSGIKHVNNDKLLETINKNINRINITNLLDIHNEVHFDLVGYHRIDSWIQSGGSNNHSKNSDTDIIYNRGGNKYYKRVKKINSIVDKLIYGDNAENIKRESPLYLKAKVIQLKPWNDDKSDGSSDSETFTPVPTVKVSPWITHTVP
jgi:hypothetical protein